MPIPKDKYTQGSNDPTVFASLTPSGDGTERKASSDFPAKVDSFVVMEDDKDEKIFAKYFHTIAAAIIKTQQTVLSGLGGGGVSAQSHIHAEINTTYNGTNSIGLPDGRVFVSNSTRVYIRGRKVIRGIHYIENGDSKGITFTFSECAADYSAEVGDRIDITFIEDDIIPDTDHTHEQAFHLYDGGNLITFLTDKEFMPGSTFVFLRGRKIVKGLHYVELADHKSIQLTLAAPEGANEDDVIEINYMVAV